MNIINFNIEFNQDLNNMFKHTSRYGWNKTHYYECQELAERLIRARPQAKVGLELLEQQIENSDYISSKLIERYANFIRLYFNSPIVNYPSITETIVYRNYDDSTIETDSESSDNDSDYE